GVREDCAEGRAALPPPFPRIPFAEAMARYGTDKPDLRIPFVNADVTAVFAGSEFKIFAEAAARGAVVRAIPAPGAATRPRSFFDKLDAWAKEQGAPGLGYVSLAEGQARGPIAKFLDAERLAALRAATGTGPGDVVVFVCDKPGVADPLAGRLRVK